MSTPAARGFVGVLMLDTRFPRPPGDVGSPHTYARAGMPVRFATVAGASAARVVGRRDASLLGSFIDAARELERDGATLITTSCGFLAAFQDAIAQAVRVPVITSSLLQVRDLESPGIVTFDAAALDRRILKAAHVPAGTPFEGLRPGCELHRRILNDDETLDVREAERNVVDAAERLVRRHPETRSLVLECTNMPPYRDAVAQATGRPVHDIETLLLARWRA